MDASRLVGDLRESVGRSSFTYKQHLLPFLVVADMGKPPHVSQKGRVRKHFIRVSDLREIMTFFNFSENEIEQCMQDFEVAERPIRKRVHESSVDEQPPQATVAKDVASEILAELATTHGNEIKQVILKKLATKSVDELMKFI